MTFWLFVIICGVIAAVELIILSWWDMKNPKNKYGQERPLADRQITLKDLLIGVALVLCPILNFFVAVGCAMYLFSEVFPKIVLFGPKRQP